MQILLVLLLFLVLIVFIIYKVNDKFGKKELFIFVAFIALSIITTLFLINKNENKIPNLFKEKYQTNNKSQIIKFSSQRVNNKYLSSKTEFIYDFDYIIFKENKEYVCSLKNVIVKKIEDEYIFTNLNKLKEECVIK